MKLIGFSLLPPFSLSCVLVYYVELFNYLLTANSQIRDTCCVLNCVPL